MRNDYRRFTRQELFDLVWSTPKTQSAKKLGISDVGLAKACRRADIPSPDRGYWAKRDAGKPLVKPILPTRGPGMSDLVTFGNDQIWGDDERLREETREPPTFPEEIASVRERVREMLGKVSVPKTLANAHPAIAAYLAEDERLRQELSRSSYSFSWNQPQFDSPLECRRLRILNAILLALTHAGMKPSVRGKEARELDVHVGDTYVSFGLDRIQERKRSRGAESHKDGRTPERLRLEIMSSPGSTGVRGAWEDGDDTRIESQLGDILVEFIVAGEMQYREGVERRYRWALERIAEREEEARRAKLEKERRERERQREAQEERIKRLLGEASALRQAMDIRSYVDAVLAAHGSENDTLLRRQVEAWAAWARAEADRIDPIRSGSFLNRPLNPKQTFPPSDNNE